ncbi:MAG: DUF1449 family protein [Sphingomonadales bacterium]|nr:DUF1449 family protein [Sphingomonadales bacterium]MDE2569012.1 DUF1449 family protein [Sphingomonadales bacterium]
MIDLSAPSHLVFFAATAILVLAGAGLIAWRLRHRDRTPVVPLTALVGARGTVSAGTARRGSPALAAVTDRYGRVHEVQVEPHDPDDVLAEGDGIVLVHLQGGRFFAFSEAPLVRDGG